MPSASVNSPSIVPPAPVGFIGLGKMGHAMARRLSGAGYRIVAHDLDPNALNRAREAIGAEVPGSLKAMASRCEAVITMLPDGNAVRAVVLGPNGAEDCLLAGFRRGGVLIDMSSSSPLATPALAAAEGVLAAPRFGLDAGNVVDILNASTGMNNSTLNKFHQFILSRAFDSGFSLELMVKDLRTALEVARSTGSPAPLAEACLEAWTEAQAALGPGLDHTAVVRHWEKLAGTELGKKHD